MSLTADNAEAMARQIEAATHYPDEVHVRVATSWTRGVCLPDEFGDEEERAVFRTLTYGDNYVMEKACRYEVEGLEESEPSHYEVDVNELRRLILKRNLLSWTMGAVERDGGWMTDACYRRVGALPAPLVEAFLREFEKHSMVTREEEVTIKVQSAALFSPKGRGVSDACEAVSLFCTLGNYSEKFGMDKGKLWDLPYREFVLLKMMIGQEGEAHRREASKRNAGSKSGTRIVAGHGGRARPSRGMVKSM